MRFHAARALEKVRTREVSERGDTGDTAGGERGRDHASKNRDWNPITHTYTWRWRVEGKETAMDGQAAFNRGQR